MLRVLRVLGGTAWVVAVNGLWGGFRSGRQSKGWTSRFGRIWVVQKIVHAYCEVGFGRRYRRGLV